LSFAELASRKDVPDSVILVDYINATNVVFDSNVATEMANEELVLEALAHAWRCGRGDISLRRSDDVAVGRRTDGSVVYGEDVKIASKRRIKRKLERI
jgi:hypothetical protein